MAKKAIVILAEGFEEIEAVTTIDILRRAGIEVTVAALNDLRVRAARGTIVMADKRLEEAGSEFDACVLPGGMPGASNLAASDKVKALLNKMVKEKKLIAAICAAPAVVLAPLGILKNKSATCFPGMEKDLGEGVQFKKDGVVVDGNVITSRGPGTALAFSLAIVEKLSGKENADRIRKDTLAG